MRVASIILFTMLIQTGMVARAFALIPCCPELPAKACDTHSHGDWHDDDSEDDGEPRSSKGIHHTHAKCLQNFMLIAGNSKLALIPPYSPSIRHLRHHQLPPDEPFLALEKPPLI